MEHTNSVKSTLYGIVAEFEQPEGLLEAARAARDAGYKKMDAYTPLAVEGLSEAIGYRNKQMPAMMLLGGIFGGCTAYYFQWFAFTQAFPLNIGGRSMHSWPLWIVPTFEMTILFTAFAGFFGMLILNGLPTLYHSIFNAPGFERASDDRFFLCIEAADPRFDREETKKFLLKTKTVRVSEVEK